MSSRGDAWRRVYVYVRSHVCMCVRVCMKVISGFKHPLKILRQPIRRIHIIYALKSSIYVICVYFCLFLVTCDVAQRKAFDCAV